MNHPVSDGTIFKIDISNELVMFVDELVDNDKDKPNLEKDVIVTFFHYLIKSVFNSNNYSEVRYETSADAINTIDDTVGLIIKDADDIPKLDNSILLKKLTELQSKLTLNSTDTINAISKSMVDKIYREYNVNGNPVTLVREDDIVLEEINITYGYQWQSGTFVKKAILKLNIN